MGRRGLSAAVLKNIAVISMLIDHIALFFYLELLMSTGRPDPYGDTLYVLGRTVGRIAFPIYCFLISEGSERTSDRGKYALRLLCTGLISEIPFSLAMSGRFPDTESTNVFFSLFLGLVSICLHDSCTERWKGAAGWAASFVCLTLCCIAAVIIRCDYLLLGPLLIMGFHLTRDRDGMRTPVFAFILAAGSALMYLLYYKDSVPAAMLEEEVLGGVLTEIWGIMAAPVIGMYDGSRGKQLPKWFYYLFYPAHLLLLWLLRNAVCG